MFFAVEKIAKQLQDVRLAIHREVHLIGHWRFCGGACSDVHDPRFDDRDWRRSPPATHGAATT